MNYTTASFGGYLRLAGRVTYETASSANATNGVEAPSGSSSCKVMGNKGRDPCEGGSLRMPILSGEASRAEGQRNRAERLGNSQ